jgi:hypothetical protein
MPGASGSLGHMADNKSKFEGFPKTVSKTGSLDGARVAQTPKDLVNLRARGYKVVEVEAPVAEAEDVKADAKSERKPQAGVSNTAPRS